MRKCTEKQAYYIYKCTERYYVGYKMRRSHLTAMCKQRSAISTIFINLYNESMVVYRKTNNIPKMKLSFQIHANNDLGFDEASSFIYKSKKADIKLHMVKCEECEFHESCEAFNTGMLRIG